MTNKALVRWMRFWPPFLGSGIRVVEAAADLSSLRVEMRQHFWNKNYVGTHFGGSLYAMTDPFFMLILIQQLGTDYIVWDKAASIRFRRPGKGTVTARFEIPKAEIDRIRAQAASGSKVEPTFRTEVRDEAGELVAEVEKLLYVKLKDRVREKLEKSA